MILINPTSVTSPPSPFPQSPPPSLNFVSPCLHPTSHIRHAPFPPPPFPATGPSQMGPTLIPPPHSSRMLCSMLMPACCRTGGWRARASAAGLVSGEDQDGGGGSRLAVGGKRSEGRTGDESKAVVDAEAGVKRGQEGGLAVPLDVFEMYMRAESERREMRQERDACLEQLRALKMTPQHLAGGKWDDGKAAASSPVQPACAAHEAGGDACWSDSSTNSSDCQHV